MGVVPSLTKVLESPYRDARFEAADILGRLGPEAEPAVPALLAILKEPFDPKAIENSRRGGRVHDPVCSAARSLGRISASKPVIAGLIDVLSSDIEVRVSAAAKGLGALGPGAVDAAPTLITAYERALQSKPYPIAQDSLAESIGRIAPHSASAPRVVAILIGALNSKEPSIRQCAIEALGKFGRDAAGATAKLRDIQNDRASYGFLKAAATAALAAIEGKAGPGRPELRENP